MQDGVLLANESLIKANVWNHLLLQNQIPLHGQLFLEDCVRSIFQHRKDSLELQRTLIFTFCDEDAETASHLLLHCQSVWLVWIKIIDWWSVYWAIPGSVDELFLNWSYFSHGDMQKRCGVWFYIQHYLWSIWKVSNDKVFNNAEPQWDGCFSMILHRVALWVPYEYR